ncbi:hypothetical protein [Novosphingobium sp. TH158]|uniref:hypothetical protein n=1 Tax=Novosphingobium sp. TH158 TaxID=2067455 RepID=UPI00118189DC|nr:hypothetical protein [Novosphingobium sp. TH158]
MLRAAITTMIVSACFTPAVAQVNLSGDWRPTGKFATEEKYIDVASIDYAKSEVRVARLESSPRALVTVWIDVKHIDCAAKTHATTYGLMMYPGSTEMRGMNVFDPQYPINFAPRAGLVGQDVEIAAYRAVCLRKLPSKDVSFPDFSTLYWDWRRRNP